MKLEKVILLGIIFAILLSGCMNSAPTIPTNSPVLVEKTPNPAALEEIPTPIPTATAMPLFSP